MRASLFVYGSLLSGLEHDHLLPEEPRLPARTAGRLFAVPPGRYPALVEGPGWVRGELVELTDPRRTLAELDDFEAVDAGLYERVRREVHPEPDLPVVHAWLYRCPAARAGELCAGGIPIPGGDWRAHLGRGRE